MRSEASEINRHFKLTGCEYSEKEKMLKALFLVTSSPVRKK
jgi:hypothetical protein